MWDSELKILKDSKVSVVKDTSFLIFKVWYKLKSGFERVGIRKVGKGVSEFTYSRFKVDVSYVENFRICRDQIQIWDQISFKIPDFVYVCHKKLITQKGDS